MARTSRSLAGKVVAITGGGRGIGRATAEALIAHGAKVAIGDIDSGQVERTAEILGHGTIGLPLDVTKRASFEGFLAETEQRLGPLAVLINNAGIMPLGSFVAESDEIADRQIEINLRGVILGSKLAIARFTEHGGGHLVNVASTAGKFGAPGGATYSATKHAVVGLSEAIRREVSGTGIDVSIVMPLVVNTDLGSGLQDVGGLHVLQPSDVADAIVDALQRGRVDVFVPRWIGVVLSLQYAIPRPIGDLLIRVLGADRVLAHPDPAGRADYNARIESATDAATDPTSHDGGSGEVGGTDQPPLASQSAIR
jgi:NAD(P)-dependent dehydrogenase (short-subunit alcohol dehydrogenase family)